MDKLTNDTPSDLREFRPPAPTPPKERPSLFKMFMLARRCNLSILFEKGYSMKLGHIRFPGWHHYMVNEPGLARRILMEPAERFPKGEMLRSIMKPLLGNGVSLSNGDEWKRQRRMIDPAFAQARLQNVFPLMLDAVDALVERLDALDDGATLRADVEMTHATADIIFRTIFSVAMDQPDARRVFDAFMRFQDTAPTIGLWRAAGLPTFLSVRRWQAERAARKIREPLGALTRERYAAFHRGESDERKDILASFIAAQDPETGEHFDLDDLIDQVAVMFLAGHETTASALSWTLYLLAMQPQVQERLHDEAVKVLGARRPTFEDIAKLKFTADVFREALRLYPPAGFLVRRSAETEQMRDKTVAAGSTVVISPWLMHRHREHWDRPNIFDPDRFKTPEGKESARAAFLPFSLGPRVCIGASFAMQEAKLVLATLVRRYRFEPEPGHTPVPIGRLTIRSENGIPLRIRRRNTG